MTDIIVAAVQAKSENGAGQKNLDRATKHVAAAAAQGAQLVLCPEFLATGYIYDETIWSAGEPRDGMTETWLATLARRYKIYVGASYLEAEGDEFFNTFTLMAPDGSVAGRVRKESLPFFEGWFFRPCTGSKVIETKLGKIGVGICNDTQTGAFLAHMCRERPDLILMPHSAPTPRLRLTGRWIELEYNRNLSITGQRFAKAFGVPVVMCNKASAGVVGTSLPLLSLLPGPKLKWKFDGLSTISDNQGKILHVMDGREGVIVAKVSVDSAAKTTDEPQPTGYWAFPPRFAARALARLLLRLDRAGRRAYERSPTRRRMAAEISARGSSGAEREGEAEAFARPSP